MAPVALPSFLPFLFYLLFISVPNALAQGQGGIPVVNPTTTPTITQPSPPAPITTTASPGGPGGFGAGGGGGNGQWCIASQNASPTALQVALDYACGYGGADCGKIQPGASCYEPNTIRDHASYAFNDYYQKHPGPESCVFGGIAQLTSTDPSKGNCHFPGSSGSTSVSPPNPPNPPPNPPSPLAYTSPTTTIPTTTPTTPTTGFPGTGSEFGVAEPTGLPSSATLVSVSLLPIFAAAGMLMPLLGEHYL